MPFCQLGRKWKREKVMEIAIFLRIMLFSAEVTFVIIKALVKLWWMSVRIGLGWLTTGYLFAYFVYGGVKDQTYVNCMIFAWGGTVLQLLYKYYSNKKKERLLEMEFINNSRAQQVSNQECQMNQESYQNYSGQTTYAIPKGGSSLPNRNEYRNEYINVYE